MYHKNRTSGRNGSLELKKYYDPKLTVKYEINKLDMNIFATFVRLKNIKQLSQITTKSPEDIYFILRKVGEFYAKYYEKDLDMDTFCSPERIVFEDFYRGMSVEQLLEKFNKPPQEIFQILRDNGLMYEQYYFQRQKQLLNKAKK